MKRFYSKFRIGLITFAFGLASVFMLSGSLQSSDEIPVNLPKSVSDEIIVVFSRYSKEMSETCSCGGGNGGLNSEEKFSRRVTLSHRKKHK